MATRSRYELGFNWPRGRSDPFVSEVARAARSKRIRWICVPKEKAESARRRVERRRLEVGLFLNTQADGVNMESPEMLLCRALKTAGTLVVEDPDDAPVYADRGLQMRYLERAQVPVPRHVVVEGWQHDKAALARSQRSRLGAHWTAQPAVGMGRSRSLTSGSRYVASALARAGFAPGQKVLILRHHKPATSGDRELRFLVWHLFGHIVPCWWRRGSRRPELIEAQDWVSAGLTVLASLVGDIAEITGLDWFATELIFTKAGGELQPLVIEPANALAGLGPGLKTLSRVPPEVVRMAASRIVEVAWRHSRNVALSAGKTIHMA